MEIEKENLENQNEIKNSSLENKNIKDNKNNQNEISEDIKSIEQKDSEEDKREMSKNSELKTIEKEMTPLIFQLISKRDFYSDYIRTILESNKNNPDFFYSNEELLSSVENIISIKELSKNSIGILFNNNTLSIYNSITFLKITEIKINNSHPMEKDSHDDEEKIINFIELKNFDLVFWTIKKIFFYKLFENWYILYQTIDESTEKPQINYNNYYDLFEGRNSNRLIINSIFQLQNGNIVSCGNFGIKIYSKKNDNYILFLKQETDIEVKNSIEIKPNKLILMQKYFESGGFCSRTYYCIHRYSLSLYDIENNTLTNLNKFEQNVSLRHNEITFFNNDKYLFIKYGDFKFDIYDINQNMQSLNSNNEIIESTQVKEFYNFFRERCYNKIKDEMNIRFLCKYSKDLFFAKNMKNEIKLYKFKDKSFELFQNFPYSTNENIGMIKLKNNNLIIYSNHNVLLINER